MKKYLGAASVLALMTAVSPVKADAINNLSITELTNPVPQSQSNPCIICGTNSASQPTGFGYNDFTATGNVSSYNTFSTNINPGGGGVVVGGLEANAVAYSGALLQGVLDAGINPQFTFGVVIDINTAPGAQTRETLESFQLINLSAPAGSRIIYDYSTPLELPDTNNGNGFGDYLITGFCLTCAGVQIGDNLLFHASWSGATDGPESFYIVAIPSVIDVPEPTSLAILGGGLAALGGFQWFRRRRQDNEPGNLAAA